MSSASTYSGASFSTPSTISMLHGETGSVLSYPVFRLKLISKPRQTFFPTDETTDLLPRTLPQPIRGMECILHLLICRISFPASLEGRVPVVVHQYDVSFFSRHCIT